jgi:hypothetical protein
MDASQYRLAQLCSPNTLPAPINDAVYRNYKAPHEMNAWLKDLTSRIAPLCPAHTKITTDYRPFDHAIYLSLTFNILAHTTTIELNDRRVIRIGTTLLDDITAFIAYFQAVIDAIPNHLPSEDIDTSN